MVERLGQDLDATPGSTPADASTVNSDGLQQRLILKPPGAASCRLRNLATSRDGTGASTANSGQTLLELSSPLGQEEQEAKVAGGIGAVLLSFHDRSIRKPQSWQAVIGVECHAQIKDRHKLFSTAQLPSANSVPNTLVAPFDAAHPATLPSLNRSALRLAIRAAIALGCHLRQESRFDRKHYFYSDLPAGYQITQKYAPLASNGRITLSFEDGHLPGPEDEVVVEVEQLQLEQDTAKSTYYDTGTVSRSDAATVEDGTDAATARGTSRSFVDLNRAGTGLMEIVSGPQMRSPEQAGAYVRKLQELLRRVGASDGNMQEGSLRCDVNVSVNRAGEPFGTRCEVKNLNSVRFMMNAIAHETQRQVAILEQGGRIEQETRGYDEARGTTFKLRGKEDAPDYRYMPDPNLPPIRLTESQYALNTRDINVLMRVGSEDEGSGRFPTPSGVAPTAVECGDAVDYFERIAQGRDPQIAVNWIIHELMKGLNTHNLAFSEDHIPPAQLGELIDLVESGKVTGTTAKSLLGELISSRARSVGEATSSDAPASDLAGVDIGTLSIFDLLSSRGLLALGSRDDLLPLCRQAIEELKQEAEKVRKGNLKVAMRIVGQVMKMAKGRADAKVVHEVILEELGHRIGDQN
ncbi:related to Glutamyl-tRNA(Gln) amidotransferase subunit B, mitochondrial [Pseudozyma flocculosa]|uniref:Glutamyl-tRNA(Gln) amidotransferase subunit B, mitochondrial n=1 Tax=Pseudozyma flocculosa TaxID=84751 RepID=A0A5C3FC27_9BASI|nr:related to Glutamyl-tRNA(Gln) amidotransferase subunit B, mitochondrial [Pseudozyma flocculosa]